MKPEDPTPIEKDDLNESRQNNSSSDRSTRSSKVQVAMMSIIRPGPHEVQEAATKVIPEALPTDQGRL